MILLAGCLVQLLTHPVLAKPALGRGHLESSTELGYTQERQTTSQQNAPDNNFDSDRFRERVHLRNKRMYILDPRLVLIDLSAGLEFFQENNDFSGQTGSQDGRLLDYGANATFFTQKPYSLFLHTNRSENRVSRNFGTRTNVTTTVVGARADLHEDSFLRDKGTLYFSTSLGVNKLNITENSNGNGQNFSRNEDHSTIQYDAHKGFRTADLEFHYQFEDISDNIRPDNGFSSHTANLNYSLDFGPTLNRRWTSILNYIKRNGLNGNDSLTASENLRIDHNVDRFSNYQYTLNRFSSSTGTTTTNIASFLVSQRLYRNLTSSLNAQGSLVDVPEGKTRSYGAGPAFSYHRHIPGNGRLTLRANGNYRINDNDLNSSNVGVRNEAHQVASTFPVSDPGFLLNHRLVLASTIVVIDRRGGGQLATTPGIDYEIISEGDATRIRPLPTSVILQTSDPLELNYSYQLAPSIRFSTVLLNIGGGIDFGWLSFVVSHNVSNQKQISGVDNGFLQDRAIDTADLQLRGKWQQLQARASAGYQREDSTNQKYTRWQFEQSTSYAGLPGLTLTADTRESFTRFRIPQSRDTDSYAANIALNGVIGSGWLTRIFASILVLNDTDIDNQTTRRAGVDTRRHFGKLILIGDLLWNNFDRGPTNSTDRRIDLRAIRRF